LLTSGDQVFASIFEGIRDARDYVLLEFYIVEDDGVGQALQAALIEAAGRGVRVYMIYDEVGSFGLSSDYVDILREAGVEIFAFHMRRGWINRWQFNFRNHRNLVIVDGQMAWVGGFNVTDDGLGLNEDFGPWRDTHVKLTGPIVPCVQLAFFEDWLWATEKEVRLTWEPLPAASGGQRTALALLSGPADVWETCTLFFLHAISSAQHRLWIASPYFVPDEQFFSALKLAALRGVDVRILVPHKPDHLLVYLSGWSAMTELTSAGIQFYRYRKGFMHQKVMLVDDEYCTVGTANFDNRSFRLNFELTIAFNDAPFAGEVRAMLERDFAAAELVQSDELDTLPFWRKLTMRLARLTAPVQ
jgi:cardiolipin synthase